MATLATQPVGLAGADVAHATASAGGDVFSPGAHALLHLVNTGGSPVTVTVPCQAVPFLDGHVADVVVTVPAGGQTLAGPFPHTFFAHPADGKARVTYSDAAHTQIGVVGVRALGGPVDRGTIVSQGAVPTDLPSGSVWLGDDGALYITTTPKAPGVGQPVTSAGSAPSDLPGGSLQFVTTGGVATDLYLAPGVSAAEVLILAAAPTDLAPNQLALVLGPDGTASDLYVGGIT